jgi:hypothetical protein
MKVVAFWFACTLLAYAGSAQAQDAKQDFTLVNRTGYEISAVYVSPSKSDDWQEDVLGEDTLDDGESVNIHFTRAVKTCKWDLKVVYEEDDSSAVWSNIDLCSVSKVTIRYNKKTDTTSAVFD